MQVLSKATKLQTDVSSQQCAQELLDAVPEVMATLRTQMRQRRAKGLSVPQFRALCTVNKSPTASISAVAEQLGCALPTASRIVTGLVSRGLLSRKVSIGDRRQLELTLTARGKSILDVARDGTRDAFADKLSGLTPGERATMSAALAIMVSVLGHSTGDSGNAKP
jgi:DNA-binding MarR family transcriptional regulator